MCPRAPAPPSLLRASLPRQRPMAREAMAKSDADGKHATKRTQQEREPEIEDSTAFARQGEGSFNRQRGVEKEEPKGSR